MKTKTLLSFILFSWYTNDGAKRHSRMFKTIEDADRIFPLATRPQYHNTYRIEKINGTWRSDWELTEDESSAAS